jgi:diacylglycerol kinase family enzyme
MTRAFHRPALICNSQSGSYDEAVHRQLVEACRAAGVPLAATVALPDDDLPDAEALRAQDIDLLAVWTGDGTINAAATRCAGWPGAVLPLPGGTLNLLSKQLHGDRPAADILTDALGGKGRRAPIPTVRSATREAFITVVAGPATRWAEVRETMRQQGLIEASRDAPEAIDAMLNAPGVRIGGDGKSYPAIVLTPTRRGLRADGVVVDGSADVLRHGLAWLGGDFRDGPSEELAQGETIVLESESPISLEYDGELDEIAAPARFAIGQSAVDFIATA